MAGRRDDLLDAAIAVLGRAGTRGLTHRAVDAAAGVPVGTTSNYFRSRDALLAAVADRVVDRERVVFETLALVAPPTSPRDLARALAAFVRAATGPNRDLALSRFALLVEAANSPALAATMTDGAKVVNEWAEQWMSRAGLTDPRDLGLLGREVDALTLSQLSRPDPAFDPEEVLADLVDLLCSVSRSALGQ